MESYRLKSKVAVNEKEFLVQTVNDTGRNTVVSSLFVDGNILEVASYPLSDSLSAEEVLALVKNAHDEKKSELEHLLATYEKIVNSGDADIMYQLATAFFFKRMFDEAKTLFSSVMTLKPDHHQAANYLGLTWLELGEHGQAVKSLAHAVELRPGYADYRHNYGMALMEAGFCRQAVEEFETALKQNIYYADAYFNLGLAYISNAISRQDFDMYSNLLEKTTDLFNRALLITPEYKSIQFEEAIEVLKQGDLPRALNLFKAVRDQKKEKHRQEFSNFYLRFLLYSDRASEKAINDRIQFLQNEIEKNPNFVDLHHELALCHLQASQFQWRRGIDRFRSAAEINPRLKKIQDGLSRATEFAETMKTVIVEITKSSQGL
jgi:tetratricopeptide (TPR) repeat protein